MSAIQKFREVTKVLNELSTAAVSARSEVQKLLTVLEGPATDVKQKFIDVTPTGTVDWKSVEYPTYTEAEKEAYYRDSQWPEQDTDPLAKLIYRFEILFEFFF